jgi:hypothetical protein
MSVKILLLALYSLPSLAIGSVGGWVAAFLIQRLRTPFNKEIEKKKVYTSYPPLAIMQNHHHKSLLVKFTFKNISLKAQLDIYKAKLNSSKR